MAKRRQQAVQASEARDADVLAEVELAAVAPIVAGPEVVDVASPVESPLLIEPASQPIAHETTNPIIGEQLLYIPGLAVNCDGPAPIPRYLTRGWSRLDQSVTWMDGFQSYIDLLIRRPVDAYLLKLQVSPWAGGKPPQTLEIFFNHFAVHFCEISEESEVSVNVPSSLFIARQSTIRLLCRNPVDVAAPGGHGHRRVGIALRSWSVS